MDLAHGVGGGADLPIPVDGALIGAVAALAISFSVLAVAWRRPRYEVEKPGRALPILTRVVDAAPTRIVLRGAGILGFGFLVWTIFAAPDDPGINPAFGIVFVLIWVGLVPISLIAGPAIRAVSPVRTIYWGITRVTGHPKRSWRGPSGLVGCWPAALGLLGFAWLELVSPASTTLAGLTWFLAIYLAFVLGGALRFGETWFERADPFEVFSTLVARLSPWRRDASGGLELVSPMRNLAGTPGVPGLVAVVSVLLGSTAFDSFSASARWVRFTQATEFDVVALETGLLVSIVALVGLVFAAVTTLPGRVAGASAGEMPRRLAHSLVPIVIGYVAAHYLTLLVETGQSTLIQASDPLGRGWDLLGISDRRVDLWLSLHPGFLASLKVGFIVLGHLLGVLAAHDRALAYFPTRHRVAGQLPLFLAMVGFTFGGLTLLLGV